MKNADSNESGRYCSRCGYDLTGLISGWRDRCPLRERCTECGLEIDWRDQFSTTVLPRWYVESGRGFFRGLWRSPGTMIRVLIPGHVWSRISLTAFARHGSYPAMSGWVVGLFLMCYLTAGLLVAMPEISATAKIAWSSKPVSMIAPKADYPGTTSMRAGRLLIDPFQFMFGERAWEGGRLGLSRLRPRWEVAQDLWAGRPFIGARRGLLGWLDPRFPGNPDPPPRRDLLLLGFSCLTIPAAFLVLRDSMKRARIRTGLLVRLGILSLGIPAAVWLGLVLLAAGRELTGASWSMERGGLASGLEITLPFLGILLLVGWWSGACRRLLKVEAWPVVLASIFVVGLLAALVLSLAFRSIDGPIL